MINNYFEIIGSNVIGDNNFGVCNKNNISIHLTYKHSHLFNINYNKHHITILVVQLSLLFPNNVFLPLYRACWGVAPVLEGVSLTLAIPGRRVRAGHFDCVHHVAPLPPVSSLLLHSVQLLVLQSWVSASTTIIHITILYSCGKIFASFKIQFQMLMKGTFIFVITSSASSCAVPGRSWSSPLMLLVAGASLQGTCWSAEPGCQRHSPQPS